ncbi:MAG: response regulator [Candidatus Doudnabacteria bacterium]|nr:response regulator [Candidatus Doudnabacteria bacterium]
MDELSKKVLIVEDDIEYRNALSAYLSGFGLEISVADDGSAAMEKLLFHMPKLVILDLMLPKVKGLDFLKHVRDYPDQNVSSTLVVVLTNFASQEEMQAAQSLGIEAYLLKSQNNFGEILKVVQDKMFKGDLPRNYGIEDFRRPQI